MLRAGLYGPAGRVPATVIAVAKSQAHEDPILRVGTSTLND